MRDDGATLHMIGNAHLDPVWLWQWPEGLQEAKATFRSALDRLNETEDFVFTSSSAAIYEWVEENAPDLFEEIRRRVAEGRWQIAGGWWIQPDCNIPGGESYVRQGLYGQRYFREKFGVRTTIGYNVDSFGHHGMLPQILAKMGMDSYVFMRPQDHEQDLPGWLFWWEADDGSRVLTFRIPYAYTAGGTLEDLEEHIRRNADVLTPGAAFLESMCFYGVGNHGGGPTKQNLQRIAELNEEPGLPRLHYSSPRAFFDRAQAANLSLPTVHDELQHHASGCYAVHSGVKRWNRQAENLLLAAEKWSAIAQQVVGHPYPLEDLTRAWKQLLFNQFHDILAGTSLESAYDDARDTYGEAMAIGKRRLHHALQALSWQIDIPAEEGMMPIVVFNPHAWSSKAGVELEFGRLHDNDVLLDDQGEVVPLQRVQSLATVAGGRNRLCFVADLPAMGHRVFRVAPRLGQAAQPAQPLVVGETSLENAWLRLEIDPVSGYVASLYDKRHAVEVVRSGATMARPVVIADPSDTWSHGVLRFDDVAGAFTATKVKLVECGPIRAVLRVESSYGASTLVQDFILYAELSSIEIRVTVDWRERFKLLKLLFPLNLEQTEATYEIPYGVIQRPENGEEEPYQGWLDLTGRTPDTGLAYGLSILNDGKYSAHVTDREIGLTVLRSPIYAHHDPYVPEPDCDYSFIDQGIQRFTYVLLPHAGDWRDGQAVRRAAELNQPAIAMMETYHDGPLPQSASHLAVDADNIVVSAVKRAEDDDALIVRCYETAGIAVRATLRLPAWNGLVETTFSPYEIKTLRVPRDETRPAVETDLIEWQ
ncbi:MAG: alpha-mannosidase [Thermomicrobiales bacterium]|nr:alpha-mannosidase [Thermomicrobiales bacterium]